MISPWIAGSSAPFGLTRLNSSRSVRCDIGPRRRRAVRVERRHDFRRGLAFVLPRDRHAHCAKIVERQRVAIRVGLGRIRVDDKRDLAREIVDDRELLGEQEQDVRNVRELRLLA